MSDFKFRMSEFELGAEQAPTAGGIGTLDIEIEIGFDATEWWPVEISYVATVWSGDGFKETRVPIGRSDFDRSILARINTAIVRDGYYNREIEALWQGMLDGAGIRPEPDWAEHSTLRRGAGGSL